MVIKLKQLDKYSVGMTTYEDGFLVSYAIISNEDAQTIKGGVWI
jgi:hypothetical protein